MKEWENCFRDCEDGGVRILAWSCDEVYMYRVCVVSGLLGTRLQHGSTTCAVYIREACSWLGSHSSVVRALAAQGSDVGLIPIPSDSLPFFLPYYQPGIL